MSLHDCYGRKINYLRLSVTDRCNLRCLYCIPSDGGPKPECQEVLTYQQLTCAARAAVNIGVEKIRVTGGEPLVRPGILGFLAGLKQIPGLKRLVLTTNGVRLEEMAQDLKFAGVESLNISLDSLRPDRYAKITGGGRLDSVLRGIDAVEKAGFSNLKINMVVMRGVNDDELNDFAALTVARPIKVRFIEYMPTFDVPNSQSFAISGKDLLARLSRCYPLQKVEKQALDGPASYYRINGAEGEVGFITPISCHFCHDCNRIRMTSKGIVKACLFDNGVLDLKPTLAAGDVAAAEQALRRVVQMKPGRHTLTTECPSHTPFSMAGIGG